MKSQAIVGFRRWFQCQLAVWKGQGRRTRRRPTGPFGPIAAEVEVLETRQLLSGVAVGVAPLTVGAANANQAVSGAAVPLGYTPQQIRHAYGFDGISFGAVPGDGRGQTIAIIDPYNDPNIRADLQAFDRQFGLPDPPNFVKLNENGAIIPDGEVPGIPDDVSASVEMALDVEWAHAIAPGANIVLIEMTHFQTDDISNAVNLARSMPGVSVVSMSLGSNDNVTTPYLDGLMSTPPGHTGVTFVAASGDYGLPLYPASSSGVLAVGGTRLTIGPDGTSTEVAWGGSGGGLSSSEPRPAYQASVLPNSANRGVPDVSYDADPGTGFALYDSFGTPAGAPWIYGSGHGEGGTSAGAPQWAALIAIADQGRALVGEGALDGATQTLPMLYGLSSSDFNDITSGKNVGSPSYSAGPGYDLVTGLGSPHADLIVRDLLGMSITSLDPWGSMTAVSTAVSGNNVVGWYDAGGGRTNSFVYDISTGNYTPLDPWGTMTAKATAVSGNIAVGYYDAGGGRTDTFIYDISTGETTWLDPWGSMTAEATGVSGDNVVGWYDAGGGRIDTFIYNISTHVTNWLDPWGTMTAKATAISGDNVVGYYDAGGGRTNSFVYNISTHNCIPVDPWGSMTAKAIGVSGNLVVGSYDAGGGRTEVFVYDISTGNSTPLDPQQVQTAFATGISGSKIVGYYIPAPYHFYSFVYDLSTGSYTYPDPWGSISTTVVGVSGNTVVGYYDAGGGRTDSFVGRPPAALLTGTSSTTYAASHPAVSIDTAIVLSSATNATLASATVTLTNYVAGQDVLGFVNDGATMGNITGNFSNGTLTLTSAGSTATLDQFQDALRAVMYFDTGSQPDTTPRQVTIQVNDGFATSNTVVSTLNVTLPPALAGASASSYLKQQAATVIDTAITVSGASGATLAAATITLTNYVPGQDVLGFINDGVTMGNITGFFSNGTLTLVSAGSTATVDQFQAALRAVTYFNGSSTPNTTQRQVTFQVNDGFAASNTLTCTINVILPPVLAGSSAISYFKQQAATPIDTAITVGDPSRGTLASATIRLTNYVASQDGLGFKNVSATMGNITGSYSNGTLTLTSAGATATLAQFQAALRAVTYANSSSSPNTAQRQVTFQLNDGIAASNMLTSMINVIAVKHAPVLAGTSAAKYATKGPATAINTKLTVTDAESATLASATVKLTNYVAGQDFLAFTNDGLTMGNITGTFSNGTLTLTSAGSTATLAQFQAALRAVTYFNSSSTPNKKQRQVTFQVSDGVATSNLLTSTIQIQ